MTIEKVFNRGDEREDLYDFFHYNVFGGKDDEEIPKSIKVTVEVL